MTAPLDLINVERAASRMLIISSADAQSAASLVNLQLIGPKKKATRFSGSLKFIPCSEGFPVVITSTLSMLGLQGLSASKMASTTLVRSVQSAKNRTLKISRIFEE